MLSSFPPPLQKEKLFVTLGVFASADTTNSGRTVFTTTPVFWVFDADSVVGVLINSIAANDEVLVRDDLGDKRADFIRINGNHAPKTITFYHAKYGALLLSASALQIVVGQAIKNLSRMNLRDDEVSPKFAKWMSAYANDNAVTLIPRIARGNEAMLHAKIAEALGSPDTVRRMYVVTSALSYAQLDQTFAGLRTGGRPNRTSYSSISCSCLASRHLLKSELMHPWYVESKGGSGLYARNGKGICKLLVESRPIPSARSHRLRSFSVYLKCTSLGRLLAFGRFRSM